MFFLYFLNINFINILYISCFKKNQKNETNYNLLQGVSGALAVLMKDAIRPNLMQTLEVSCTECILYRNQLLSSYGATIQLLGGRGWAGVF